jgi:hypothetical protein
VNSEKGHDTHGWLKDNSEKETSNKMNICFQKYSENPEVKPAFGTFYSRFMANPDLCFLEASVFCIFGVRIKEAMIK